MRGLDSGFDVARAGWEFPEGTCAGYKGYPSDPVKFGLKPSIGVTIDDDPLQPEIEQAVKLSFSAAGIGGVRSQWEAVLWKNRLYVAVTQNQLADGSKHAFVSLLEYAEEELGVDHVVACLDSNHNNKNVIRNFLFLGFEPIAAGHEYFPLTLPNVVCFLYTI